jgi:small subunit ribosomal protein S10
MNITRSLGLIRQLSKPLSTVSKQAAPVTEAKDDYLYRFLKLKCSSHEVEVLDSYERFLKLAAQHLDIEHVKTESPFRTIKRKTMLASRFVKKKYRVQYEFRSYYRDVLFRNLTGSTADTFLEYVERNLPEGVMMIVEKHKLSDLPFDLKDSGETLSRKDDETKK